MNLSKSDYPVPERMYTEALVDPSLLSCPSTERRVITNGRTITQISTAEKGADEPPPATSIKNIDQQSSTPEDNDESGTAAVGKLKPHSLEPAYLSFIKKQETDMFMPPNSNENLETKIIPSKLKLLSSFDAKKEEMDIGLLPGNEDLKTANIFGFKFLSSFIDIKKCEASMITPVSNLNISSSIGIEKQETDMGMSPDSKDLGIIKMSPELEFSSKVNNTKREENLDILSLSSKYLATTVSAFPIKTGDGIGLGSPTTEHDSTVDKTISDNESEADRFDLSSTTAAQEPRAETATYVNLNRDNVSTEDNNSSFEEEEEEQLSHTEMDCALDFDDDFHSLNTSCLSVPLLANPGGGGGGVKTNALSLIVQRLATLCHKDDSSKLSTSKITVPLNHKKTRGDFVKANDDCNGKIENVVSGMMLELVNDVELLVSMQDLSEQTSKIYESNKKQQQYPSKMTSPKISGSFDSPLLNNPCERTQSEVIENRPSMKQPVVTTSKDATTRILSNATTKDTENPIDTEGYDSILSPQPVLLGPAGLWSSPNEKPRTIKDSSMKNQKDDAACKIHNSRKDMKGMSRSSESLDTHIDAEDKNPRTFEFENALSPPTLLDSKTLTTTSRQHQQEVAQNPPLLLKEVPPNLVKSTHLEIHRHHETSTNGSPFVDLSEPPRLLRESPPTLLREEQSGSLPRRMDFDLQSLPRLLPAGIGSSPSSENPNVYVLQLNNSKFTKMISQPQFDGSPNLSPNFDLSSCNPSISIDPPILPTLDSLCSPSKNSIFIPNDPTFDSSLCNPSKGEDVTSISIDLPNPPTFDSKLGNPSIDNVIASIPHGSSMLPTLDSSLRNPSKENISIPNYPPSLTQCAPHLLLKQSFLQGEILSNRHEGDEKLAESLSTINQSSLSVKQVSVLEETNESSHLYSRMSSNNNQKRKTQTRASKIKTLSNDTTTIIDDIPRALAMRTCSVVLNKSDMKMCMRYLVENEDFDECIKEDEQENKNLDTKEKYQNNERVDASVVIKHYPQSDNAISMLTRSPKRRRTELQRDPKIDDCKQLNVNVKDSSQSNRGERSESGKLTKSQIFKIRKIILPNLPMIDFDEIPNNHKQHSSSERSCNKNQNPIEASTQQVPNHQQSFEKSCFMETRNPQSNSH